MIYSINLMFISLLTFSTIIVISSPSWFCMWIGIEMNTMAFIPMMYQYNNKLPTESALKYFLIQTFASTIMMFAIILMMFKDFYLYNSSSNIMLLAMGIKSGIAPFHMWYPSVVEGLPWAQNMILMTWQKIAPLTIMSSSNTSTILIIMTITSLIIGPISAFNQSSLRKIMAYSSITHMSWITIMMVTKSILWSIYMLIYFITTIIMILSFQMVNANYISQINSTKSLQMSSMIMINLLSMGGFPPLLGFISKWLILNELITNNMIMISIMLVMSSCLNLYIYLRIMHPLMHLESSNLKFNISLNNRSLTPPMITMISLFSAIFLMIL